MAAKNAKSNKFIESAFVIGIIVAGFAALSFLSDHQYLMVVLIFLSLCAAVYINIRRSKLSDDIRSLIIYATTAVCWFFTFVIWNMHDKVETQICDFFLNGTVKVSTFMNESGEGQEFEDETYRFVPSTKADETGMEIIYFFLTEICLGSAFVTGYNIKHGIKK